MQPKIEDLRSKWRQKILVAIIAYLMGLFILVLRALHRSGDKTCLVGHVSCKLHTVYLGVILVVNIFY
jgi:hypothetical protein